MIEFFYLFFLDLLPDFFFFGLEVELLFVFFFPGLTGGSKIDTGADFVLSFLASSLKLSSASTFPLFE